MYGDDDPKDPELLEAQREAEQLAVTKKEARAIANTNEAILAKVPGLSDTAAQVRTAVFGTDIPAMNASYDEWLRYCIIAVARTPARSKSEAWELKRTYLDLVGRRSSYGREDKEHLIAFAFRIAADVSVSDNTISGGITGISALVTSDRRETLNQTIRQPPPQPAPGLIEGFKNLVSGRRTA